MTLGVSFGKHLVVDSNNAERADLQRVRDAFRAQASGRQIAARSITIAGEPFASGMQKCAFLPGTIEDLTAARVRRCARGGFQ